MAIKKKKSNSSKKSKMIGEYDVATIYYGNEELWTFRLSEWELYRDYDWVEVVRKDGKGMESFNVSNVARISFGMDKVKEIGVPADVTPIRTDTTPLKPVA